MSDALPYTRDACIPLLLGVKNYLNNDFAIYKRLTRFRLRTKLASPAYFGLGIIEIIILPCMHVCRAPVYARSSHRPPTGD